MPKLIIEVATMEQAEQLARWYEGQGEQDAGVWFDIQEIPTPMTKGSITVDKETETVTLRCG